MPRAKPPPLPSRARPPELPPRLPSPLTPQPPPLPARRQKTPPWVVAVLVVAVGVLGYACYDAGFDSVRAIAGMAQVATFLAMAVVVMALHFKYSDGDDD